MWHVIYSSALKRTFPHTLFFVSRSVAHPSQLKSARATGWPEAVAEVGRELTVTTPKGWSE